MRERATGCDRERAASRGLSTQKQGDALERLAESDLGKALLGATRGTKPVGPGTGNNTKTAFGKLAEIASKNDSLLNSALGQSLVDARYITTFLPEVDFGTGLTRRTDLLCEAPAGPLRLELMWRARTGRAEIANYALTKLYNYGRAIGFLSDKQ